MHEDPVGKPPRGIQAESGFPPGVVQLPGPAAHKAQPHSVATPSHAAAHQAMGPIQGLASALRWTTFGSTARGLEVPVLSSLPRRNNSPLAKCACKKRCMDFHGDHTATCTAHSSASKAHVWIVSVLGPLFCTAGHTVRTQQGVTASAGQRRGDVEIRNYLRDQAGSRSLVFDLSSTRVFKNTQPPSPPPPLSPPPPARVFKTPPPRNRIFKKTTLNPRKESSKTIISSTAVPNVTVMGAAATPCKMGD
jgi:hypothetical protein